MGGCWGTAVGAAALLMSMVAPGEDARAQGSARSLDLDTSVRSLGRGGASTAVFWDGGNEWANPALLGYRNGLSVSWERHEFVPEFAGDVVLSSRRVSLGLWGVGFSTSGQPVDVIGGTDLDYGLSQQTDIYGNSIGIHSYEHIRAWSLGVSAATVLDQASALFGRRTSVAEWADVAVGASRKRVRIAFWAPETYGTNANDVGWFARVSPLDTRRLAGRKTGATHRVDLGFGHSVINANDAAIDFFSVSGPAPTSRIKRDGGSAAWTMRASPEAVGSGRWARRVVGRDGALVRVAIAFDRERFSTTDQAEDAGYEVDRWGAEATYGRVCALRLGYLDDNPGDLHHIAWGFSLGAPLGPLAELAYDFAGTPQGAGRESRHSHALTLRLDVLETLRSWREEEVHAAEN